MGAPNTAGVVALRYDAGCLLALDQTRLPFAEVELSLRSAEQVAAAIKRLSIRGAPLIGVAAAYGIAVELARDPSPAGLERACGVLRDARPTAANLAYAVDRVRAAVLGSDRGDGSAWPVDAATWPADAAAVALAQARAIDAEEQAASDAIARHGAELLAGAGRVMTHCNTGALAAPGRGTALAVIAELAARGALRGVIATESRPLLQGARLTVWELGKLGIPHELVVDSAAAGLIAAGALDAVIVGCDRVAANGDVANKVGTYGLALAARAAGIRFVVAGPTSTIDSACPSAAEIVVEQRDGDEVRRVLGTTEVTVPGTPVRNPAFDLTPARLVTALVTERGVASPVDAATVGALLAGATAGQAPAGAPA
jgi:methylthioribose-1-phosphate isomerase